MRYLLPLLAAAMLAMPAYAQTAPSATAHARLTMQQRFEQANVTNDGHLTLEQAQAKYKNIARHFTAIDRDKKGYVTVEDIRAYYKTQRALHRQSAAARREPDS